VQQRHRGDRQSPPRKANVKRYGGRVLPGLLVLRAGVALISVRLPSATLTGMPSVRSIRLDQPPPSTVVRTTRRPAQTHCSSIGHRLSSMIRSARTRGPLTDAIWPNRTGPSTGAAGAQLAITAKRQANPADLALPGRWPLPPHRSTSLYLAQTGTGLLDNRVNLNDGRQGGAVGRQREAKVRSLGAPKL
jgi:hypothetical protein